MIDGGRGEQPGDGGRQVGRLRAGKEGVHTRLPPWIGQYSTRQGRTYGRYLIWRHGCLILQSVIVCGQGRTGWHGKMALALQG